MTSRKPDHFGERASAGSWAVGTHVSGEASAPRPAPAAAKRPESAAPRKAVAIVAPPLVTERAHIDEIVDALRRTLAS